MKKIYIFTAVLALLTLSLNAQLQAKKKAVVKQQATADKVDTRPDGKGPNRANRDLSVTVNGDGTKTNEYIPVYGYYSERTAKDQIIYTASQLNLPAGSQITSLTFYTQDGFKFTGGTMTVSLGTTNETSFSSTEAISTTWTQVASFTPASTSSNEWTINFTTNFIYNGGNLIVQFEHDGANSGSSHSYFYGVEASNMSLYSYYSAIYQSWSGNVHNFQPKVTFAYIGGTDPLITASSSNLTFKTAPGEPASQTVTIAGYNLTDDITATVSGDSEFSVSPTTLGTNGGNLTVTYSPTATGSHSATLTLSSTGAEDVNITLNGSCVQEATICDGTDQNNYLPLYGYYYDAKQVNQMIYPADKLTSLVGTKITSMTFYSPHIYFYNGKYTVKVGTTSQTSFSSMTRNTADLTATVASNLSATAGGTELTITFDAPFEYNGGNLLVDFEVTTAGNYGGSQTSFYGENQSTNTGFNTQGSSLNSNGVYTGTGSGLRSFLPKVTFTYENSEPRHDLSIALSAPASVVGGNSATVTATVTNTGNQTETGYTVTITDGTNNLLNQTATETLAPGATATFTTEYNTTEAQVGTTVNFAANVACTDDADATNNSATASMQIISMPAPENVAATTSGNNATMTWTIPSNLPTLPQQITESFENGTNGWTFIDADGDGHNWMLHNNSTEESQLRPNTGDCVVYSESFDNETSTALTPNNWLISPEVILDGSLSLYACGQDNQGYHNEVFGVYVCVGSYNGISDFTQIGADVTTNYDMTQYTYNLSQYNGQTGYIAIVHHNITDQFILNIDDITYQALVPTAPVSYNIYLDGELMGNVAADAALTYNFSNLASGGHTASVSAVYPGGIESAAVPAEFTILPTPNAPTVSSNDGTTSTTITITPDANTDGQLVYYVVYNGSQTQDLTFPRGANDYTVEVHAYTTATSNYNQSPDAVVTVTIPALPQTAAPTIGISSENDEEVTITATGNGTVTLNIPGYPQATGTGSASITVPRHITDYVVTATATAQADGELVSTTTTEEITIESMTTAGGWLPIEGTYTGDEPISLIDEATHKLIKFEDHFSASTMYNAHADKYDYIIREENNPKTSNTVTIPVFKTYSIMNGLYTEAEVLADSTYDENRLTANALNSKMTFDTQNANEMYRYQLYRGELNENPVIDLDHTISQLQESGDLFTEQLTIDGISPMVEHAPAGTVVRNDRCFFFNNNSTIAGPFTQENPYNVENADELAYVPVIWTMGFRTGRLDDLNNSYGSDIKRNVLNGANVITTVIKNEGGTNKFKVEGSNLDYYVYAPEITIDAKFPAYPQANDGDGYTYEPYMYRVWCTYTDAHAYSHLVNPDGNRALVDAGVIPAPFLIGEVKVADLPAGYPDPAHVVVGGSVPSGADWADYPWSFGAPKNTAGQFEFVIRYYYKKVVTDAAPSTSGLRGNRDGEDYYVFETKGSADNIVTGVNELWNTGKVVISQTYVNAQGMQSDKPFDGLNIVVTRFSDGTTTTTKVVR